MKVIGTLGKHDDLVINTETLTVDNTVDVIGAALGCLVECKLQVLGQIDRIGESI